MKKLENKKDRDSFQNTVGDYGNDPYFVKKANKSKVFLEKHGSPQELLDKKNKNSSLVG
ncbi:hypothetical protein H8B06_11905 [Sphingobacterium sp. DN00404]|uniref:Uncharacterized protein n=1 Tax=Sphingobacterium micropteri TaxID=2763501 RepID=A0ABR7YQC7_9SPHI|nr:hypothetical protein [Sphingobacterium micropteri]MBD1433535.1 hypothetical protein [Sphingobacterium micropteri]